MIDLLVRSIKIFFLFFFGNILTLPILLNPIPDQTVKYKEVYNFSLPKDTFFGYDTYHVSVTSSLPFWITETKDVLKTSFGSLNTSHARGVYVEGNYAYIADRTGGLKIINITDKSTPTVEGIWDTTSFVYGVYVEGNYAYITDYGEGLKIINITYKSTPTVEGSFDTNGYAFGVFVEGNYAYIADLHDGLKIININNKSTPILEGVLNTNDSDGVIGVYVSGNYAYLADGDDGLKIININDKSTPILVGSLGTSCANGVYVEGNYAYIADGQEGLKIININDKSSPTVEGSFDTIGYAYGVFVEGNYAYIADEYYGIIIININDKSNPILEGSLDTDYALGVYVEGNYAYIADYKEGLKIIGFVDVISLVGVSPESEIEVFIVITASDEYGMISDAFKLTVECYDSWRGSNCSNCPSIHHHVDTCKVNDCETNWSGENCDVCDVNVFCSGHATACSNGPKCICDKNWSGDDCSICDFLHSFSETCEKSVCEENWGGNWCNKCEKSVFCDELGTKMCIADDDGIAYCVCNKGYIGDMCDEKITTVEVIDPEVPSVIGIGVSVGISVFLILLVLLFLIIGLCAVLVMYKKRNKAKKVDKTCHTFLKDTKSFRDEDFELKEVKNSNEPKYA